MKKQNQFCPTLGVWEARDNKIFIEGTYNSVATVHVQKIEPQPCEDPEKESNIKLLTNSLRMFQILEMIVEKRLDNGWDAECCALLAESMINKIKND